MRSLGVRATRLIYVENDSALRGFLEGMLSKQTELEIVGSYQNAVQALDRRIVSKADVALLDFGLESDGLNGIELGIALRAINEYIGIVIYSQFNVRRMIHRVPRSMRNGWSFLEKSGEMTGSDYVRIFRETVNGKGNWENFVSYSQSESESELDIYYALTVRQRSIIALLAQGITLQEISVRLDLTYSYVRKELSRAYALLIPDAGESDDLKTRAILKYLQIVKTGQ